MGFMGCGKSTLGKKLANKLGYNFADLDKMIEQASGRSIPQLFEQGGEAYFRAIEKTVLLETASLEQTVVALGGGTPCTSTEEFSAMDWINANGYSIFLDLPAGMLFDRLRNAKAERPLLAEKSDEALRLFIDLKLAERRPFYERADRSFEPHRFSLDFLVEAIS